MPARRPRPGVFHSAHILGVGQRDVALGAACRTIEVAATPAATATAAASAVALLAACLARLGGLAGFGLGLLTRSGRGARRLARLVATGLVAARLVAARGRRARLGDRDGADLVLPVLEPVERDEPALRSLVYEARELRHAQVLLVEARVDVLHDLLEAVGAMTSPLRTMRPIASLTSSHGSRNDFLVARPHETGEEL